MTTALVTGATGFIGGNLTRRLLQEGWRVRALVRNLGKASALADLGVELAEGDLNEPASLKGAVSGQDYVFHCAALIHQHGWTLPDYLAANVHTSRNLCEALQSSRPKKIVALSSVAAIGIRPAGQIREDFPCRPDLDYGISKLKSDEVFLEAFAKEKLPVVLLRPPTVYGPGERYNFLTLCRALRHGPFLLIGDGRNRIDFLSVGNLVEAMVLAAQKGTAGEVYLVADQPVRPFRETIGILYQLIHGVPFRRPGLPVLLARLVAWPLAWIEAATGRPMPLNPGRVRTMSGDFCFDLGKITSELGYHPVEPFETAAARTIAWYRENNLL